MLFRKEQLSFIQLGANDGVYRDPLRGLFSVLAGEGSWWSPSQMYLREWSRITATMSIT